MGNNTDTKMIDDILMDQQTSNTKKLEILADRTTSLLSLCDYLEKRLAASMAEVEQLKKGQ